MPRERRMRALVYRALVRRLRSQPEQETGPISADPYPPGLAFRISAGSAASAPRRQSRRSTFATLPPTQAAHRGRRRGGKTPHERAGFPDSGDRASGGRWRSDRRVRCKGPLRKAPSRTAEPAPASQGVQQRLSRSAVGPDGALYLADNHVHRDAAVPDPRDLDRSSEFLALAQPAYISRIHRRSASGDHPA